MSTRRKICKPLGTCRDVPMRGGKRFRCTVCETEFPCAGSCEHLDCCSHRGDPLPMGAVDLTPDLPVYVHPSTPHVVE